MQDEVAKHTKKIYHAMKNPGHSFWEKVKEVTIEIFIIVFAVTLSIWFHNWSDHRHEQKETEEFEMGLKDDLSKDIKLLKDYRNTLAQVDSNFRLISALNDNKGIDTVSEKYQTSLKDLVKSYKMRALLQIGAENFKTNIGSYDSAVLQAKRIILLIDRRPA